MNYWQIKSNFVYWEQEYIVGEKKDVGSSAGLRSWKSHKTFLSLRFLVWSGWLDPIIFNISFHSVSSVAQSCLTLCDPMDCSTPGFPVYHQLLELPQIRINDAIQPSHPLSSPSPAFSLSQHLGLFKWVQFSVSGGPRIGVSASASVLPVNIQDWFPLGWTVWISLQSKGLSRVFSNTTVQKHQFFRVQLSHPYMITGKTIALTIWTFVSKLMSLLFNMLSRFVIAFLPRSKRLLISWLQSPSAVILEPRKTKSATVSTVFPIYLPWSDGTRCHELSFLNAEL